MYNISLHTVQINTWIALTKSRKGFSHTLQEHGYECDFIDKTVEFGDEISKPDIVLTSVEEDHSIVVECKQNGLDWDQFSRYKSLESNSDILLQCSRFSSLVNKANYVCETCYSSFTDLSVRSILLENPTAFIHFERTTSGTFLSNLCDFKSDTLQSAFPINMKPDEEMPVEYYPFDIEHTEDYTEFVSTLIQAVIRTSMRDGVLDVQSVLKEAHPYWTHIGTERQDRHIEEAKKVMVKLENTEDFMSFIENISNSETQWKVHYKTADAIQTRLQDPNFVEDVAKVINQSTFDDDESSQRGN